MIIAIDGYEANVEDRVGIGRYAFEILRHLYPIIEQTHSARIYLPTKPLSDMPKETAWWMYRIAKPSKLWTLVGLPLALSKDRPKADVIFSPTHYVPRFVSSPRVMSIMDLSYLYYPEMFKPKDLHQLVTWTAYSVRNVKKILTISEFTKNAILQKYNVPSDRVVVTHPGFTALHTTERDMGKIYNLSKNYILSVGTLQPRKNFVRLIEAFAQALPDLKEKFPDISLVIAGKKGWLYEEILAAPEKYGVEKYVTFLDFVPDSDLPNLYKDALCFVLPSLYEGFGLPVLEAMAYGIPVVVSNVSSLPEIAGKAGIYVDPKDTQSIAKGMEVATVEREKKSGKDRIAAGLNQVKKFTWEKSAKQTLEVLQEVGKGTA